MEWDDRALEGEFEGIGGDTASAGLGREDDDADGAVVAAHFLLTASRVCELVAEALLENSEMCCDAGLGAEEEGATVVAEVQR